MDPENKNAKHLEGMYDEWIGWDELGPLQAEKKVRGLEAIAELWKRDKDVQMT
jgi:glutamate--cysteine ligase catalytic subunit